MILITIRAVFNYPKQNTASLKETKINIRLGECLMMFIYQLHYGQKQMSFVRE